VYLNIVDYIRLMMVSGFILIIFVIVIRGRGGYKFLWSENLFIAFFAVSAIRHGLIVAMNDSHIDVFMLLVHSTLIWAIGLMGIIDLLSEGEVNVRNSVDQ
jgi:hypothetical protein